MDLREEIFSHQEKLWVIYLDDSHGEEPLPPLLDAIDWYNNQILTRTRMNGHLNLSLGAKTLFATSGQLPVTRLIVCGLGKVMNELDAKTLLSDLNDTLNQLSESDPWVIIPPGLPQEILNQFHKQKNHFKNLTRAQFSV